MPDFNIKAELEVIMVVGDAGGDGGSMVLTPHGLKRVPDNNPELREAYRAIVKNYGILKNAALDQKFERGR